MTEQKYWIPEKVEVAIQTIFDGHKERIEKLEFIMVSLTINILDQRVDVKKRSEQLKIYSAYNPPPLSLN